MRSLSLFFALCLFLSPLVAQTAKPKVNSSKTKAAIPRSSPTAAKRPQAASAKKSDENAAWEKATRLELASDRIVAFKKFNEAFPRSEHREESLSLLVTSRVELGNAKLTAADLDAAVNLFRDAAANTPKVITDELWTAALSKIPFNLYFAGRRNEAYEIADVLAGKIAGSSVRTLALANFYLTVEDGSSARRLIDDVIAAEPSSGIAYQTLGLAYRVDFQLEDSAAAYSKAVELDPGSLAAKRGLAEAKRSLARPEEGIALYREILTKDDTNIPARTGLVLSMFDAGKRADAETEMVSALSANEGNVILLAGAAYWYAAHNEGEKAIQYAQKAIAADPRYIWSHIALARGYLLEKKAAEAEKVLFNAQRYGNFPTLQYELASARLSAGYYRDAADELAKSFVINGSTVTAKLGGRIAREGKDLTDVIGHERKASIFEPAAADDKENAARLAALLELRQILDAAAPDAEAAFAAAARFASGEDPMRPFRHLYAARDLLDKKVALAKVIELAKAATAWFDNAVEAPSAATTIMAPEIYNVRAESAKRGEYVNVPAIPKDVMLSVLRGESEAIIGWAYFQMNGPEESLIHLRRAASIFPPESAWWRTNMWRLGSVLAATGKEAEGLDTYIKVYRSGDAPNAIRYAMIEALYKRVNGNSDGLVAKIGPDPSPSRSEAVPTPVPTPVDEKLSKPMPAEPKPCTLITSDEAPVLSSGTALSIVISSDIQAPLDDVTATSSNPSDLIVERENGPGISSRAVFVLRSAAGKLGVYTVTLVMPCGKRELPVTVK